MPAFTVKSSARDHHRAAVDAARAHHDRVGRRLLAADERAELLERSRVEQVVDAGPDVELAGGAVLLQPLVAAHRPRHLAALLQVSRTPLPAFGAVGFVHHLSVSRTGGARPDPVASYDSAVTSFETLLYSKADGVAWVSLNRPEVRNAINQQMQDELRELWHDFRYDDDVRCVVLTGEGEAFCTGIDRAEAVSEANTDAMAAGNYPGYPTPWMYDDPGRDIGPKAATCWKPVIAAVNGMACGGAFYMLGEVEFIIAADDATFFDPHVTYGMTAAFEPIQMLAQDAVPGDHADVAARRPRADVGRAGARDRPGHRGRAPRRAARAAPGGRPGSSPTHRRSRSRARCGRCGPPSRSPATRPSSSPTCSPASGRTPTRSGRGRSASSRASARSGACGERSEVVDQVDDGRGLLAEHDPPDDLHVGSPVLLGGRAVARLEQIEEPLLRADAPPPDRRATRPTSSARLTAVTARATISLSISATMVSVWFPASDDQLLVEGGVRHAELLRVLDRVLLLARSARAAA